MRRIIRDFAVLSVLGLATMAVVLLMLWAFLGR
jgi:hypothetical protein